MCGTLESHVNRVCNIVKLSTNKSRSNARLAKCSCVKDMLAIASSCPVSLHNLTLDFVKELHDYYDLGNAGLIINCEEKNLIRAKDHLTVQLPPFYFTI